MALTFKKAQKAQSKLRMSIAGPSGSGKTYSSLKIATEMGGKIAFIDTERGSAAKYSDIFDFDVIELDDFHPDRYIEAIKLAEKEGYDIIIIDSTTHEWNGKNGILELHEAAVQRQRTKNSYTAWAEITPLHNAFINAILQSKCHVIASVRSKTEYVQEKNDRGQTEIKKVGMASIQRADMDYEYDVMMELNIDHTGVITKTRCAALDGKYFKKPGREIAEILTAWLSDGTPAKVVELATTETIREIERLWSTCGYKLNADTIQPLADFLAEKKGVNRLADIPQETAAAMLLWLQERGEKIQAEATAADDDPRVILRSDIDELCTKLTAAGVAARRQSELQKGIAVSAMTTEQLTAYKVALATELNEAGERKAK